MSQLFCLPPRNIPTEKHDTINPLAHLSTSLQRINYTINVLRLLNFYITNGVDNTMIAAISDKRFAATKNASKEAAKQAQLSRYFGIKK